VHRAFGPGLLESAYEAALEYELEFRGLKVDRQLLILVRYREVNLDAGYRIDLLVDERVVLQIKSVKALVPIHQEQLLGYLKLGGFKLGYMLNFNTIRMKNGIKRMVNDL